MTTLFDITLAVARELGEDVESVVTAGTTSSITDANFLKNRFNDDAFNQGTAWLWYDVGDAGVAPEGEYSIVSDFVKSSGVLTLQTALTVAPAVGDRFVVTRPVFRLAKIIGTVNRVLQGLRIPKIDETLSTAAEQLEYTLPTTFKGSDNDLHVWMQAKTDDADANYWFEVFDWYIKPTSTGTAKTLVFTTQPNYIRSISLRWTIPHAAVHLYNDTIDESVSVDLLTWRTAIELLRWLKRQPGVENKAIDEHIGELNGMLLEEEWRMPAKDTFKLQTLGDVGYPVQMEDDS